MAGHGFLYVGVPALGPVHDKINGLVQDCSNSSALAMELLQSCAKPSKCQNVQSASDIYWDSDSKNHGILHQIPIKNQKELIIY